MRRRSILVVVNSMNEIDSTCMIVNGVGHQQSFHTSITNNDYLSDLFYSILFIVT